MNPVTICRLFRAAAAFVAVALATLLTVALNAHADPREAKADTRAEGEDALSVTVEIPSDMLTTDTLKIESAPVIQMDDIAVFELPGEETATAPGPSADDEVAVDGATVDSHVSGWEAESIDVSMEAPELDLQRSLDDDLKMPQPAPRIEMQMPAPEITLDF